MSTTTRRGFISRLLAALTITTAAIGAGTSGIAAADDVVTLYRLDSAGASLSGPNGDHETGALTGRLTLEKGGKDGDERSAVVAFTLATADERGPMGQVHAEGKGVLKLERTPAQKWKATLTLVMQIDVAKPPVGWGRGGPLTLSSDPASWSAEATNPGDPKAEPITFTGREFGVRADPVKDVLTATIAQLKASPPDGAVAWPF